MTALLVVLMMTSGALWARGAYKWIDDNGVVHYSDRMRGSEASVISVDIDEPEADADNNSQSDEENTPDPASDEEQMVANAKAEKKQKALRKANCAKAREQLATNESMSRMYRVGKNGEREYLNDKQRADVIRRSVDSVKYWCD